MEAYNNPSLCNTKHDTTMNYTRGDFAVRAYGRHKVTHKIFNSKRYFIK